MPQILDKRLCRVYSRWHLYAFVYHKERRSFWRPPRCCFVKNVHCPFTCNYQATHACCSQTPWHNLSRHNVWFSLARISLRAKMLVERQHSCDVRANVRGRKSTFIKNYLSPCAYWRPWHKHRKQFSKDKLILSLPHEILI